MLRDGLEEAVNRLQTPDQIAFCHAFPVVERHLGEMHIHFLFAQTGEGMIF